MTTFTRGCFGHCPDCGVEVEVDGVTGCICIPDTDADTNTITTEKCPCMGGLSYCWRCDAPECGCWEPDCTTCSTPAWEGAGQSPHPETDPDGFWLRPRDPGWEDDGDLPF